MKPVYLQVLCILFLCSCCVSRCENADIEARLARLEKREAEFTQAVHKLRQYEETIVQNTAEMNDLKTTLHTYEQSINNLNHLVRLLAESLQIPKHFSSNNTHKLKWADFTGRIKRQSEAGVAFHALIDGTYLTHLNIAQPIPFMKVLYNAGAAFHGQHGLFIAPINGIYLFSVTISSATDARVGIIKNGNTLADAIAHSYNQGKDQGSNVAIIDLKQGDEVYIKLWGPADTSLYANSYSSFSGTLLHYL